MLLVKLLPCACRTNQSEAVSSGGLQIIDVSARVGMVRIVGLCFPQHWSWREGPLALLWPCGRGRGAGWGCVYI